MAQSFLSFETSTVCFSAHGVAIVKRLLESNATARLIRRSTLLQEETIRVAGKLDSRKNCRLIMLS